MLNQVGEATREFFLPCTGGTDFMVTGARSVGRCDASGEVAVVEFSIPADFQTLSYAKLIIIPRATQAAADWDITTQYGKVGEGPSTHTATEAAATYNVTDAILFEIDVAALLADLAAGDNGGIIITEQTVGHDFDLVGLRLKYS